MTFNPNRYEHPYGIHLLDDVHNLFPEFLYDPGLFSGNQLVTFLQMRTNELFEEEYAHNRSQYRLFQLERRRREAGIPTPYRRVHPFPMHTPQRPNWERVPIAPQRPPRSQRPVHPEPVVQTFTVPLTTLFTDLNTNLPAETTTNAMNTLLTTLLGRQDLADLLTPIVVAPTREEIDQASILSNVEPPADVTCAICQDHAAPTNSSEWRIIRHCSHRFHRSCIDEWFRQNVHCPVCRYDIREDV
jgi:hypothetical protein